MSDCIDIILNPFSRIIALRIEIETLDENDSVLIWEQGKLCAKSHRYRRSDKFPSVIPIGQKFCKMGFIICLVLYVKDDGYYMSLVQKHPEI